MNSTEDQLTGALDAAAETVRPETVRPLREPEPAGHQSRRRPDAWLAPIAAAAAVVLVVALALVATSGTGTRPRPAPSPGEPGLAGPPGLPRYYAEVEGKFFGKFPPDSARVVVRSSATGAVLARIKNPVVTGAPALQAVSVTAAPDDRTFYALYSEYNDKATGDLLIYRFTITPSGHATGITEVSGGRVTGQNNLGNAGGFAVSPDGARLALAVAATGAPTVEGTLPGEILVIDLRTGAHAVWRGGMDRAGRVFGIKSLSWTGDGKSVVYLGEWCPPDKMGYGIYGDFGCSAGRSYQHRSTLLGSEVVRRVTVTAEGGALNSGPLLFGYAVPDHALQQVLANPGGSALTALIQDGSGTYRVVTMSATGKVSRVIFESGAGAVGDLFIRADRTGRYLLLWQVASGSIHGWIDHGALRTLPPDIPWDSPLANQGGWLQMTW